MGLEKVERAKRYSYPKPALSKRYLVDLGWNIATSALGVGALLMHDIKINTEKAPKEGPVLFLTSHFSFLDVLAQMVADPYHNRTMYALKEELANAFILGEVLQSWGAIPVSRDGKDSAPLRRMVQVLADGRSLCIAAGGTRSRDGHLTPIDDVVAKFALDVTSKGVTTLIDQEKGTRAKILVPVYPIVEIGTFEAMPRGSIFPKRREIQVVVGDEIDFMPVLVSDLPKEQRILIAAGIIQKSLADLLPPQNRPLEGTPVLWTKADYIKSN